MDEPTNPSYWADAIANVIEDAKLMKTMSKKGLKTSMEFNWRKTAKQTWKVYEEVMK